MSHLPGRDRKDARRNHERVVAAAHALFAQRGTAVTMEEVALAAGVGVGTVYRCFGSKEQLFAAVSRTVCHAAHNSLHAAATACADPAAQLLALVAMQYQRSAEQSALLELLASGSCGLHTEQQQLYAQLEALLARIIARGQQAGAMQVGDPAVLAALCAELLTPRTLHKIQHLTGGSADEVAQQVVSFMLGGLASSE